MLVQLLFKINIYFVNISNDTLNIFLLFYTKELDRTQVSQLRNVFSKNAMIAFLSENSILYRNYLTENLEQYYCIPVCYLFVFVLIENIPTFIILYPTASVFIYGFIIVLTYRPLMTRQYF